MKDYFAWQGTVDITGSRDATRREKPSARGW